MPDLLKKPNGTHGKVHEITPESAGWTYVGFGLYHLRAGEKAAEETLALPVYPGLTPDMQEYVVKSIAQFYT